MPRARRMSRGRFPILMLPLPCIFALQHVNERLTFAFGSDREGKARKVIALNDAEGFKLETAIRAFSTRFLKEDRHGDGEAIGAVTPGVLAGHAVEPAFPAAGDGK